VLIGPLQHLLYRQQRQVQRVWGTRAASARTALSEPREGHVVELGPGQVAELPGVALAQGTLKLFEQGEAGGSDPDANLDGRCGYIYERNMLSFQRIDYPPWDMYFCHEYHYDPLTSRLTRARR
jgi:hypothetical protein